MQHDLVAPREARADWTIEQEWTAYSDEDHRIWDMLFERQARLLQGRAAECFLAGLDIIAMGSRGIPNFRDLSQRLDRLTGWRIVAVPGLIPAEAFFDHLAARRFPASTFIRSADQLDYLQEPDVFHDVFGHVPLLSDPVFADYMQAYGQAGQRATRLGAVDQLARLYWYTVEFGLVRQGADLKIYGAGIASSAKETIFSLESRSPNRVDFDIERVMRTAYRIDHFQQTYFVVDSLADLLKVTQEADFAPIYRRLAQSGTLEPGEIAPCDVVHQYGDHAEARGTSA